MKKALQVLLAHSGDKQVCYALGEIDIVMNSLLRQRMSKVKRLITKEIVIAQKEGTPTSRLTSLYNNIIRI